jgi:hypothetical protein
MRRATAHGVGVGSAGMSPARLLMLSVERFPVGPRVGSDIKQQWRSLTFFLGPRTARRAG